MYDQLIAPIFTIIGILTGAIVTYYLDKEKNNKITLFNTKREVYGKVLGRLRSTKEYTTEVIERENEIILSEAILLSNSTLRNKLVLAGNSLPNNWENIYGKDKSAALQDIEFSMREELGIKIIK